MTHAIQPSQRNARPRTVWLLPEDGVIDTIAIDLAARGERAVALTPVERRIAAAFILAAGGSPTTIAKRLHMAHSAARDLAEQISTDHLAA